MLNLCVYTWSNMVKVSKVFLKTSVGGGGEAEMWNHDCDANVCMKHHAMEHSGNPIIGVHILYLNHPVCGLFIQKLLFLAIFTPFCSLSIL